jgi:hypothetical protein
MKTINENNLSTTNVKCIRGIRNFIRSSINKENHIKVNNPISEGSISVNNIDNKNISYNDKKGANTTSPTNDFNEDNIRRIKNNIEEIIIKTNYSRNNTKDYNTQTTPVPISKQNKKFSVSPFNLNIKKLDLPDNRMNNTFEASKRKSYSHSFRYISTYNISDDKNNTIPVSRNPTVNNSPRIYSRFRRKMSHNSDLKSKINMKINTININNINGQSNNNKIFIKKNNEISRINNNNIKEKNTYSINSTFDIITKGLILHYNNENNKDKDKDKEIKYLGVNTENEIKMKLKENNEIKQNILLMMDELNKIKERQEQIMKAQNENQLKNNDRIIKISNIIKKTYAFLNDFNSIINEQNYQIYQEIIKNLNKFFSN